MAGSSHKNLQMFGSLCGDDAAARVVLVSTMWQVLAETELPACEEREVQLRKKFWSSFIGKGSGVDRLKTSTPGEAWRIVDKLIARAEEREAVLLQEEIVNMGRELKETEAGKTLYTELQNQLANQKKILEALRAQAGKTGDSKLKRELERQYKETQKQFEKTFAESSSMTISLWRRIKLLFGKKPHAVSQVYLVAGRC
jgi:hypothetical protein